MKSDEYVTKIRKVTFFETQCSSEFGATKCFTRK